MKSMGELLFDAIEYILCKLIKANMNINSITELTEEEIDKIISHYGIKGVILDVDETLRYNMEDIPDYNKKWLEMVAKKLKVVVLSNGMDMNIKQQINKMGIEYIGFGLKPLKINFIKACNLLGLKPSEVIVIGDDILSDIYGAKRNKMTSIKVDGSKKVLKR